MLSDTTSFGTRYSGSNSETDARTRARHRHTVTLRRRALSPGDCATASFVPFRLGTRARSSHPLQQILLCLEQASTACRRYLARTRNGLADGSGHMDRTSHHCFCPEYCRWHLLHGVLREFGSDDLIAKATY